MPKDHLAKGQSFSAFLSAKAGLQASSFDDTTLISMINKTHLGFFAAYPSRADAAAKYFSTFWAADVEQPWTTRKPALHSLLSAQYSTAASFHSTGSQPARLRFTSQEVPLVINNRIS